MKRLIMIIISSIVLIGCAEDKGNYSYRELNDVAIILTPKTEDGSGIDVLYNQRYKIEPILKRTFENLEDDLSFEWTIDGEVVSTERNLDIIISDKWPFGRKEGRLAITDNKTGMKYFSPFGFKIINSFSLGYYTLCRKVDNSSILYYLKEVIEVVKDAEGNSTGETILKEPVIASTSTIGDLDLGEDPVEMVSNHASDPSIGTYTWTFNILSRIGKCNVITTRLIDFLPVVYVGQESFADQSKGYEFHPSAMGRTGRGAIVYLSDGQVINQLQDKLYRPSKLYPEYSFSKLYIGPASTTFLVYDDNSAKCYFLAFLNDANAYDAVLAPEGAPNYRGKTITGFAYSRFQKIGGTSVEVEESIFCAVAGSNQVSIDKYIHLETLDLMTGKSTITTSYSNLYNLAIPDVGDQTKVVLFNKDWYISSTNTIYISPFDIPNATSFYTIPEELGEIRDLRISVRGDKLVIACYNPQSAEEKKGSLIVMDIQTKKANIYKFFMDEPVVLNCCDEEKYS